MSPSEQRRLHQDVEAFCQEIRPIEELCYVEHRFNDQVVPLARKHGLLPIPVPGEYGGRGPDTVSYVKALARITREGTGVRTFSSGHPSIGAYPILPWGSDEQRRRYLPADPARGAEHQRRPFPFHRALLWTALRGKIGGGRPERNSPYLSSGYT